MKKIRYNKRKCFLAFVQIFLLGIACLGVLKYSEEISQLKKDIKEIYHEEISEKKIDFSDYPAIERKKGAWYEAAPLIYHAGGGIGGYAHTNSKEALEKTLESGNRFVEIDFLYTSDNQLACVRLWKHLYVENPSVPTLKEFEEFKLLGIFTPLTAKQLIEYMVQYPDLYIVIDTKNENCIEVVQSLIELTSFDRNVTNRFIIQLYDQGVKEQILQIYPFEEENFLFSVYKYGPENTNQIMRICYEENIAVITVPYGAWDQESVAMFREKGFIIYEHTVNRLDYAKFSIEKGVNGFYTDYLTEEDLE